MKNERKKINRGRYSNYGKFNLDPTEFKFIEKFQRIMIRRLDLNRTNCYSKSNIGRIVLNELPQGGRAKSINTSIKGGFNVRVNLEPELYILIQETAMKITGNYMPMNSLIHLLLTYFCDTYKGDEPKQHLPFNQTRKNKRYLRLLRFQSRFKKYYKNCVRSFVED